MKNLQEMRMLDLLMTTHNPYLKPYSGLRFMRGVGFEPTNPYGSGSPITFLKILSPPPLARLGYPRSPPIF